MDNKWLDDLSEEDRNFIKRFVLASGSLKDLAKQYNVTYPTLRLRLDRLIAKMKVLLENEDISDFERVLRSKYAEGKIDGTTFKHLLETYKNDRENTK